MRVVEDARADRAARPLLGLRRRPGRLALAVFRLPLPLYRAGWGRLLGRTFMLLVHRGRRTGRPHAMTAMVLRHDPANREVVICSGWGATTDWVRNVAAGPALRVQVGADSFVPQHRFLDEDESVEVGVDFCLHHPVRVRLVRAVLGWDLRTYAAVRAFAREHPFVAFRPVPHVAGRPGRG